MHVTRVCADQLFVFIHAYLGAHVCVFLLFKSPGRGTCEKCLKSG